MSIIILYHIQKKLDANKKRFFDYKFILNAILNDNISENDCKKLYPNEYNNYLKCLNINDKIYKTFNNNKTFNTSKPEKELLEQLLKLCPDTLYQYKYLELYTFNCDFYIPSLDLFIEYHGSHFHCNKEFDNNDKNDLNKLNELLEKSSIKHKQTNKYNQYDMMIYTWTDLDVRKKNYMIKNNLNFFNLL